MNLDTEDNNKEDFKRSKPIVLLLVDGWGIAPNNESNAFAKANISHFLELVKEYPVAILNPGNNKLNERYFKIGQKLTDIISKNNLKQIKIAETERFVPISYYFNQKTENKSRNEEQLIISSALNSPRKEIAKEILKAIKSDDYDFIFSVIADIDICISRGEEDVIKIIEDVDEIIKKISVEVLNRGGVLIISAANGNAEKIKNIATEIADDQMTNSPVPFIIVGEEFKDKNIGLVDPVNNDLSTLAPVAGFEAIAPTILDILKIDKNDLIEGESLIA